jgi:CRP-like cAMP-binding protein
MNPELLKTSFDKYYELPLDFWASIAGLGVSIEVDKETTLKEPNAIENSLYFILRGSAGILLWNNNNFKCTDIVLDNDFICDYLSILTSEPTPFQIITFEKSTLIKIPKSKFISFTEKSEYGDKFWRYAIKALYIEKNLQYIQLLTNTASDIYSKFQAFQPDILNRIPQKYIASYLGVTPQSLSRIRS